MKVIDTNIEVLLKINYIYVSCESGKNENDDKFKNPSFYQREENMTCIDSHGNWHPRVGTFHSAFPLSIVILKQ